MLRLSNRISPSILHMQSEKMLKYISLTNFRGFREHRIELSGQSILIGRNNAGKTTTIEALRVLSVCQTRAINANFIPRPDWLDGFCEGPGFRVSLEPIDFDFTNIQRSYDTTAPATLLAKLANNNEIRIYIGQGDDQVFCQLRKGPLDIVHTRTDATRSAFGLTKVMPPIGSILPNERAIAKDRLNRYLDGYLAYRHFRNQLWERSDQYRTFKKLLEETWIGLQIQHFENDHGPNRNEYSLLIREGKYSSEISWHGHGLQARAQTIWFLSRVDKTSTIVLDEPDVYLHADLQRKLIKVIESLNFHQTIIATHSAEIISDVPFNNVIVIEKQEKRSKSASRASDIQKSLRSMGSIHSIQLSKLAEKGVILFIEGDDDHLLADVAFKMGVSVFDGFSKIATNELKGKGNWQQAIGGAKTINDASDGEIKVAMLLDRDYMLDDERASFEKKANEAGVYIKIWERKEIENYFLIPDAIARFVNRNGQTTVTVEDLKLIFSDIENRMLSDLTLTFADSIRAKDKGLGVKASYKRAEALVSERIDNGLRIADMVSGKDVFSELSGICQSKFGCAFNALSICKESKISEISNEIKDFISAVCELRKSLR